MPFPEQTLEEWLDSTENAEAVEKANAAIEKHAKQKETYINTVIGPAYEAFYTALQNEGLETKVTSDNAETVFGKALQAWIKKAAPSRAKVYAEQGNPMSALAEEFDNFHEAGNTLKVAQLLALSKKKGAKIGELVTQLRTQYGEMIQAAWQTEVRLKSAEAYKDVNARQQIAQAWAAAEQNGYAVANPSRFADAVSRLDQPNLYGLHRALNAQNLEQHFSLEEIGLKKAHEERPAKGVEGQQDKRGKQ